MLSSTVNITSIRNFEIKLFFFKVLSGQYLHLDQDSYLPIRVDIEIVGVPQDCALLSTEVSFEIYLTKNYKRSD